MSTPIKTFTFEQSAHYAFTEGDCWVLARAICEDPSYELVTISSNGGYWFHAGARRADGTILDIDGIWTERNWMNHWGEKLENAGCSSPLFLGEWDPLVFDKEAAAVDLQPSFYVSNFVDTYRSRILELLR